MSTDDRIALAMAELLRHQGYAATGLKQVVETAGAPVGSIYHHYPGGKRDVAAAALRSSGAAYGELVEMLLAAHGDLVEAIDSAFRAAADTMEQSGWLNMCPVATVAGEVADTEPLLRTAAAEVMDGWLARGAALMSSRGLSESDARSLMRALLAALEGAFIMARALRSADPILDAGRAVAAYATALGVPGDANASAAHSGTTHRSGSPPSR